MVLVMDILSFILLLLCAERMQLANQWPKGEGKGEIKHRREEEKQEGQWRKVE